MNVLFFKMAFRHIVRNKLHSLINIIGFSIGIATALCLFLFIHHETGFDKFMPAAERTYRMIETIKIKDNTQVSGLIWYPLAQEVKSQVPSVESCCRVSEYIGSGVKANGHQIRLNKIKAVDGNFLDFFGLNLVSGAKASALNSPDKIVLSEETASLLFGTEACEGRQIEFLDKLFTVSGVVKQMPSNTHLSFDALVTNTFLESCRDYYLGWTGGVTFVSYIRLMQGVSPAQVKGPINSILDQHVNIPLKGSGMTVAADLQKITDIHLHSDPGWYDIDTNRSLSSLCLITLVGLILLLLAVFNYISLYIAQKTGKTKDMGILSVHGANRLNLKRQLFLEVLIVSFIAGILAWILFRVFTPFLNSSFNTSVSLKGNILPALIFIIALNIILSFIITFFAGRGFSTLNITGILKGEVAGGSKMTAGKVLVAVQFFVITVLLTAGLYIHRQYKFLLNHDLGFDSKNVLVLSADKNLPSDKLAQFKQQLMEIPEISGVSLTTQPLGSGLTSNGYMLPGEEEATMINIIYTDTSFLDLFNIKLTSGRNFSGDPKADSNSIIVNNALVKYAGWKEPLGQDIRRNGRLRVIGTVNDFNFSPLSESVKPLIISCNPAIDGCGYSYVNILCRTQDMQRLTAKLKTAWEKSFPDAAVEIDFLDRQLAANYDTLVSMNRMITFFTLLVMLIACLGLMGLTIYMVQWRTKEIGVRKTNGATIRQILLMLNVKFLKWIFVSMLLSFPVAWVLINQFRSSFAYQASVDIGLFLAAGALAMITALLTITHLSWKAASQNPVEALRYE